jgi:hypothetical protein
LAVRFNFHNGNSVCVPYAWLGPGEHNPSTRLLLKVTGDVVLLVLICSSYLDALVGGSSQSI